MEDVFLFCEGFLLWFLALAAECCRRRLSAGCLCPGTRFYGLALFFDCAFVFYLRVRRGVAVDFSTISSGRAHCLLNLVRKLTSDEQKH